VAEDQGEDLIPHHGDWKRDCEWSDPAIDEHLFTMRDGPQLIAEVWKYGDESYWWMRMSEWHGEPLSELQVMVMLGMSREEVRALGKGRGRPG